MKTSQFLAGITLICALFLASCANTVRGVGTDVRQTAEAVEDVVE